MTDTQKQDFTLKITQATPVSMITILYEIVSVYLEDAQEAAAQKDRHKFIAACHHIQDCMKELTASVNREVEPAGALLSLYRYIHKQTIEAIISFSGDPLEEPVKIINRLHEAYLKAETMGSFEPVMQNTQQIYAGLTYGRNSQMESMEMVDSNRGFRV